MRTLDEYDRALFRNAPAGHSESTCNMVEMWLAQDAVQELLAAAWDPELVIRCEDHGVQTTRYTDPDTGKEESFDARHLTVECTVAGTVYGKGLSVSATHEPLPLHWQMLGKALREALVKAALGT